jgi:MFS family permease
VVKVISGTLSDAFGRRKPLVVLGYGLGAVSKPLFALASSAGGVFGARFLDRIGKGVRGAPRDALIADLTPRPLYGAAFGLRQSLDTVGAFAGPLVAIALMHAWDGDVRAVFRVAVVPAALAVALLVIVVREPERRVAERVAEERAAGARRLRWSELRRLPARYWQVVALGALVALARFSEAFLVLRATERGLALAWAPLALVAMNAVYALAAYPFGRLSDRASPRALLALGLATLIAADLALAAAASPAGVLAGVALWGLSLGITQGLFASLVASAAPDHLRGTAFGGFHLASGLALLAGSAGAGLWWDRLGPASAFLAGAAAAGLALLALALRPRSPRVASS